MGLIYEHITYSKLRSIFRHTRVIVDLEKHPAALTQVVPPFRTIKILLFCRLHRLSAILAEKKHPSTSLSFECEVTVFSPHVLLQFIKNAFFVLFQQQVPPSCFFSSCFFVPWTRWIGFVGKILTGNQSDFSMKIMRLSCI